MNIMCKFEYGLFEVVMMFGMKKLKLFMYVVILGVLFDLYCD